MKKLYKILLNNILLSLLLTGFSLVSLAQTTITTETGTNYTGASGLSGPGAITFVVENTTAVAKILTQVDVFYNVTNGTVSSGTITTLWYSSTSLGGAPIIGSPDWTSIVTSPPLTIPASGYYPTFTGMNFLIPANTQYRFAVQSSMGISYTGLSANPSPSTFSAGGVNLKLFDVQIAGGNVGYGGSFPNPVNTPRAFTGRITFIDATPCSGTPVPGNTISTANPVCSGINFTLSAQNPSAFSGITYQWQSSPDGVTWTDIATATNSTLSTSQTVPKYYRVKVTCAGSTGISNALLVGLNPVSNCYCTSNAANTSDEDILNVTYGTLNNTSTCASVGPGPGSILNEYSNYTSGAGAPAAPNINAGVSTPFSVQIGTCGGNFTNAVAMWIDLDHNGIFDATERMYVSPAGTVGPHTETANVTIPLTALPGITRMRIVNSETGTPLNIAPCGTYGWGETEDYLVNIVIGCVPATVTTQPANTSIICSSNATFTVATAGSGVTVQWQESTNGGTSYASLVNNAIYSGVTTNTLTITGAPVTMTGNLYRALLNGTCTALNTVVSNSATLTVTQPPAPAVSPANPVVCLGGIVPLSISSAGSPTTTTFASGPISVLVPDNSVAGATHTIPVSGIPAGAVITAITVAVNMPHTYIGDEVFALKAPNGAVLNLDYYLTASGGAPAFTYPTIGFTNTRFSSASVATLASSANTTSYNGIYKADGFITGPAVGGYSLSTATGPTGYAATVATFPGLYSTPNGNWTIAMYDGGAGDIGTLTSWSVTITYGAPQTGIWSPTAGLFTDPAATIPYTGTSVNTVYAKPAAATTYTVTITQGGCTSPPTSIPITVNTPASITSQPTAAAVCAGSNTSFSVTGAGTAITFQWQVSTDNGVTYSNIAGETSSTYAITAATNSMNGYKYRVVVTGAAPCGSVTSNAVTLTVNALPRLTIAASPRTKLIPTTTTTLTATVTPAGTGTYKWFLNGVQVPGVTNNSLVVDIDHIGDYSASVTDVNGCTSFLSNIVTISDTASGKLFLYPNPNHGKFHVRYYTQFYAPNAIAPPGVSNIEVRYISVYDMVGQRIIDKPFSVLAPYGSMDVDLTPFGKGTYFILVKDVDGNKLASGRAVVQ